MLNCDPPRQGVIVLRPLRRIKFGPPLNCNPQALIPRWIMTPGLDSTLNYDPESWFNIKLWPGIGITIQCGIVTRGHNSTWNFDRGHNSTLNCDPESWLNVELWPGFGITIQCGILTRGHNSTWNFDPGSKFNVAFWPRVTIQRGILTRLHIFYLWNWDSRWCQNSTVWSKFNS